MSIKMEGLTWNDAIILLPSEYKLQSNKHSLIFLLKKYVAIRITKCSEAYKIIFWGGLIYQCFL